MMPPLTILCELVDASARQLEAASGSSDGRFIAQVCPQVIELGPPNASIHKIDEHVVVADIEPLKNIYRRTLENLHAQAVAARSRAVQV